MLFDRTSTKIALKLYQLKNYELTLKIINYFDINEGFPRHAEKNLEAQKIGSSEDLTLIDDANLLHISVESM